MTYQDGDIPDGFSLVETGPYNALRECMVAAADQVKALERERDGLLEATIVPGSWACPQCVFSQTITNLYVNSGTVGPNTDTVPICPNDGALMRRVTWKELVKDYDKALTDRFDQIDTLKQARDALREKLRIWIRRKLRLEYAYRGHTEEEIAKLIDDPDFPELEAEQPPTAPQCWPNLCPPAQFENAEPGWKDPKLPDIRLIWKLAREVGYAVGVHGSLKRDMDLIAAPWTDEAVGNYALIQHLCEGLRPCSMVGMERKPHGRVAVTIQLDGYFKPIDLSIMPRLEKSQEAK